MAVMVTVVTTATRLVLMVKVALVSPPGIVTLPGTEATSGLLLESGITAPPGGAGAASVTRPCAVVPPPTEDGEIVSVSVGEPVTLTNVVLVAIPPLPSPTRTVIVTTVSVPTLGGVKVAVGPLPEIVPASADQTYCRTSPSTSWAVTDSELVWPLATVSGVATGPLMKWGGVLTDESAGLPSTSISASPIFRPSAWSILNRTQLTTLGVKTTFNPTPLFGSAPTGMVEPSLNRSVAPWMWSVAFGRSKRSIWEILTGVPQSS